MCHRRFAALVSHSPQDGLPTVVGLVDVEAGGE